MNRYLTIKLLKICLDKGVHFNDCRSALIWQPLSLGAQVGNEIVIYHFAATIYFANADVMMEDVTILARANPAFQRNESPVKKRKGQYPVRTENQGANRERQRPDRGSGA